MEASGWACHCDGRCPSAARALLISNHIDEKEFTTAIFSALFHGRGKQRNIALLVSSANEGNLSSGPAAPVTRKIESLNNRANKEPN